MVKIKKIIKIVMKFVAILVVICFVVSIVNCYPDKMTMMEVISKTGLYFLYTIGYGALEGDAALQNILAMIGIIWAALMSTYLTINLFWRFEDVSISKDIIIDDDTIQFTFNNNGVAICDVNASFVLYDEEKYENINEPKEFSMPIMLGKSHWCPQANLNNTFWYRAVYDMLSNPNRKLYCTFSFADTKSGQTSIRVEEIKKENLKNRKKEPYNLQELLKTKLLRKTDLKICDNGSRAQVNDEGEFLNWHYQFIQSPDDRDFAMVFYDFKNNFLNLEKYNKSLTFLKFKIYADRKITLFSEIKTNKKAKHTKVIELDEEVQDVEIQLSEINECLEEVNEICFTIFNKENPTEGNVKISDLNIITH